MDQFRGMITFHLHFYDYKVNRQHIGKMGDNISMKLGLYTTGPVKQLTDLRFFSPQALTDPYKPGNQLCNILIPEYQLNGCHLAQYLSLIFSAMPNARSQPYHFMRLHWPTPCTLYSTHLVYQSFYKLPSSFTADIKRDP